MKKKYRVTNWKEYNVGLTKKGPLICWVEEGFDLTWYDTLLSKRKKVPPYLYLGICIELLTTVHYMFKLTLRQLEGLMVSLFPLLKIILMVPEFSRLSPILYHLLNQMTTIGTPKAEKVI